MSTLLPFPRTQGDGHFSHNGTALSKDQRLARAKRRGVCPRCGIKTHSLMLTRRTAVTDNNVHQGHCIECDPDMVPLRVCIDWEQRNPDKIGLAKRTALHSYRGAHRQQQQQQEDGHGRRASAAPIRSMKDSSAKTDKTEQSSSNHLLVTHAEENTACENEEFQAPQDPPQRKKSPARKATSSPGPAAGCCQTCGIQTHEKIKVKSAGFLKKSKTQLRPLSRDGAVLAGRCLLCHPIPNDDGAILRPPSQELADAEVGQMRASAALDAPMMGASNHTTSYSPRPRTVVKANRRSSAPASPTSVARPHEQTTIQPMASMAALPKEAPPPVLVVTVEDQDPNLAWADVPSSTVQTAMEELEQAAVNGEPPIRSSRTGHHQEPEAGTLYSGSLAPSRDFNQEEVVAPTLIAGDNQVPDEQMASINEEEAACGVPTSIGIEASALDEEHPWWTPGAPTAASAAAEARSNTLPVTEIQVETGPCVEGVYDKDVAVATEVVILGSPQEHAMRSPPEGEPNAPFMPRTSSRDPPGDPPDDVWPLPWPLNIAKENEGEGDGDDDDHHSQMGESSSEMSSMHFSAMENISATQRRQTDCSIELSSFQASNSFACSRRSSSRQSSSSRQLNDSLTSIPALQASFSSNMDGMSNSQMLQSRTSNGFSSSNSLMAEMMTTSDLASWLQDLATQAQDSDEFRAEAAERGGIVAVISAMKTHKTDGNVQQFGCLALHALAKEHGTTIAKNGGVQALISAMKHHGQQDPLVQEYAAGALVYVVVNDGYKAAVAKKGGIPCILAAMRRHADNLGVQKRCCMVLLKLSSHRDVIDALASPKHRGVYIVVESMKQHKDDLAVNQYASGILKNIAQKDSVRSTMVKEGGVLALVETMKLHKANAILNQQASWALCEISSSENIARQGAIVSVIAAMRAHCQNEAVQQYGCGVIANLSITKENIYSVAKLKGIATILDAMTNHLDNAALQRYACRAIKHLSLSSTNERAIGRKGGIITVMTAMKAHKMDGTVQREAVGALRNLTLSDDNKSLVQHGAIEALFDAIKHNTHDIGLQEKAGGALLNLSSSPEMRRSIGAEGVVAVVNMMRLQSSSAKVQELLCGTLKNLALSADLKTTIAESDGINAILSAMKRHSGDSKMLSYALGALKNLAGNTENRQGIAKQKGIIAVLSIMKQHPSVATVQQEANMVLLNMSVLKENNAAIGKHGGIAVIVTAMRKHPQSTGVQSSACAALWNLSVVPANQALIHKASGISAIIAGLKAHVNVTAVCHKACLALSNMAVTEAYRGSIADHGGIEAAIDAMKCHVREANCQKYACKFLSAMLKDSNAHLYEIGKGVSAVKVALQYHSDNADLKRYAHKVLAAVCFYDDTVNGAPGRHREITSIEV